MPSGRVTALFLHPASGSIVPTDKLVAVEGRGLEGDRHFGKPKRQVLLLSTESLNSLRLDAGVLREQVTVDYPGLQQLPAGTIVKVGEALLCIEGDCEPCAHMARELGEEPEAFIERARGRRGMLAAVAGSGTIKVGDSVAPLEGGPA